MPVIPPDETHNRRQHQTRLHERSKKKFRRGQSRFNQSRIAQTFTAAMLGQASSMDAKVPLEVPSDRQFSLALRWLVDFADARKGVPMKDALAAEILEAYQGQGNAIRKHDEV